MKKKWLCLFIALAMAPVLTGCDSGGGSDVSVAQPDGGGDNGSGGGDNGNGGGDNGGGDNGNGGGESEDPCRGTKYTNARNELKSRNEAAGSETELIDYSLCVIDQLERVTLPEAIQTISHNLGDTLSWSPGAYSQLMKTLRPDTVFSLLPVNSAEKARSFSFAMAGEDDGHRFITFGGNPIYRDNEQLSAWMQNMVTWITGKNSRNHASYQLAGKTDGKLHVIIAQMKNRADDGSYSTHYDAIKTWLDKNYPDAYTLNAANSCDYDQLEPCLSSQPVDLLIVSDRDKESRGYDGIRQGIEFAIANKIPLMTMVTDYNPTALMSGIYGLLGIYVSSNYSSQYTTIDYPLSELLQPGVEVTSVRTLLNNLEAGHFDPAVLEADGTTTCKASVLVCSLPAFMTAFRDGADVYRNGLAALDARGIDVLSMMDKYPLFASGVLLADKYRQQIDYPVVAADEPAMFQKAMFADWTINYTRPDNRAQPDLGEYVVKSKDVTKGDLANFALTPTLSDSKTLSIPYPKQWTTSGWYAPAGKPVTITSTDDSASVVIQLGFGYTDVYWSAGSRKLVAPSEVSLKDSSRLVLAPGKSVTFSTPYGAPVYIRFTDSTLTRATLSASGITSYPAILDFNDSNNIASFEEQTANGEYPHVDIKSEGVEVHLLKFRFTDAMGNKNNPDILTTSQMLEALKNFYVWNYTLGGFKIQGKTLAQSLPANELAVCSSILGEADCTDESLHTRTIIQHVNYDQRSRCVGAGGCSGNPFDTSWEVAPYGWGESHELGHNLQINRLNVQYVEESRKEEWTGYASRAGETSNNIFPYFVLWKRYDAMGFPEPVSTSHGDPREVYSVVMSELRGLQDSEGNPVVYDGQCRAYPVTGTAAARYTVPWETESYPVNKAYREAFYQQMLLQVDKQKMRQGQTLENGFDIFTLLYQHSRIYGKYAKNETDWNAHRDQLGFGQLPYSGEATYNGKNVDAIPGNDFMLISLSYFTDADWRPYFDMFGLHYTSLASQQVESNGFSRTIEQKIFTNQNNPQYIPGADISADPDLVMVDLENKDADFPGKPWNCP